MDQYCNENNRIFLDINENSKIQKKIFFPALECHNGNYRLLLEMVLLEI